MELGRGSLNENVPAYIGDPDDAFVWETKTFGRLPAGINLVVGDAPAMRAGMVLVEQTYGSNSSSAAIRAAPGGGGAFRAFLSSLQMALRGATGSVKTRALLDLSAMDYCEFDVLDLLIAPGRESAEPTDDERGELWLPPGTATVANAVIGAADGATRAAVRKHDFGRDQLHDVNRRRGCRCRLSGCGDALNRQTPPLMVAEGRN